VVPPAILMGAWAKHPFALATGLGVNAFSAVTVATNPGLAWRDMMGLVMLSCALIRTVQGRARDVHPLRWVVAAAFLLLFGIGSVEELLGVK
jgi:xanthine/uracil/vitamin C permease (AzgA family)